MHTRGFSVNTADRNDVVAFWQAVYTASEGFESRMNWTGNYSTGDPGSTSRAYMDDVERRVNYFRAMAGVPADVTLNTAAPVRIDPGDAHVPDAATLKSSAAQRAAFLVTVNNTVSHNPPSNSTGFSAAAWNGCAKGNLGWGLHGPRAVTEYFREVLENGLSNFNVTVGHRRWLLLPRSTDFATGDVPASANHSRVAANSLYVVPRSSELRTIDSQFVSYPSAGFFPAPVNSKFWSLSYRGADFSAATVTMTDAAGTPMAVTIQARNGNNGDPAIVWQVPPAAAVSSVTQDVTFHVHVAGISGAGVPTSHSYSVTLIHPDLVTANQSLTGTNAPAAGVPARYFFQPPSMADSVSVTAFRSTANSWTENAEVANETVSRVIDGTAANYSLRATASFSSMPSFSMVTGSRSFRLSFPYLPTIYTDPNVEQSFELDRAVIPLAGASLGFRYKRGYTTSSTALLVETSSNDGVTWQTAKSIVGRSDTNVDTSSTNDSITLPAGSTPLRVRFRLVRLNSTGQIYDVATAPNQPTGFFIDEIAISGGEWLDPRAVNHLPAGSNHFTFSAATAGATPAAGERWTLRMRTRLGNRWMNHGPPIGLTVAAVPLTGYGAWEAYQFPTLSGGFNGDDDADGLPNGVEYAFSTDPLTPSQAADSVALVPSGDPQVASGPTGFRLKLQRPLPALQPNVVYGAEWSEDLHQWSSEGVTLDTTGGIATATAAASGKQRFMRWKITRN
jgi:hypothetical protein